MDVPPISEEELSQIYTWVKFIKDKARPKKNITRDFADGCMMAELVHHFLPKIVEVHNYPQAHSVQQKQYNWSTLNVKVFKKLGIQLSKRDIDTVIQCQPEAIERVLRLVQTKIEKYIESQRQAEKREREKELQQQQSQQQQQTVFTPQLYADPRIAEKDAQIQELKETVEILELKIKKLEQLVQLKDGKISSLINQLNLKQ